MIDLLNITRLLVIAGYALVGVSAFYLAIHVRLLSHRIAAMATAAISLNWVVFYTWLMILAPLDPDEVRAASILSRVMHAPVIAGLGVMMYALWIQVHTLNKVNGNGES